MRTLLASITLFLAVSPLSRAGMMGVSPVRVELSKRQPAGMLTIDNKGDEERLYQIEVTSWTQAEGEDHYEVTRDLVAYPPVFKLRPKQSQIVRLGLQASPTARELAFRLFVHELPVSKPTPDTDTVTVQTLLRIGIPVFVAPAGPVEKPVLEWTAERDSAGITGFVIRNPTTGHVQLGRVKIEGTDEISAALYILPGQQRRWRLPKPLPLAEGSRKIDVDTDRGPVVCKIENTFRASAE